MKTDLPVFPDVNQSVHSSFHFVVAVFQQVFDCSWQRFVKLDNKLRTLLATVLQYVVCQVCHGELLCHRHFDELLLPDGNDFACIFPIKTAPSGDGLNTLLGGVEVV